VQFEFFPLRFEFTAREPLYFPPGKAANILRGALGVIFRRIACVPECEDARTCEIRHSCPYASVFAPVSDGEGPSGLADSPRPFVFRARHLDGHAIQPGQPFYFDLHVFSLDRTVLPYFVLTFAALAREGLGPRRGKADLQRVRRIAVGDLPEQILYEASEQMIAGSIDPASVDLDPVALAPQKPLRQALFRMSGVDLTGIDGIGVETVQTVISEYGPDLSRFPTEHQFVQHITLAPHRPTSAGKPVKTKKRGSASTRVAGVLRMAALSLRHSETALGAYYRQTARRTGGDVAVFASARKLATLIYRLLRWGQPYVDEGAAAYEKRYQEARIKSLTATAKSLGFQLTPKASNLGPA
jgi:hypothetical protein